MARPIKNTVDYFPHIVKSGKTIFILENKFGNDGYAFWFKLLELLAQTEGHYYDCNNQQNWLFLVAKTRVSEVSATEILDTLSGLDAIDKNLWVKRIIWSQNFVDNITDVYKKRQSIPPKKPIINLENKVSDTGNHTLDTVSDTGNHTSSDISDNNNSQSKVKESKVNINTLQEDAREIFDFWNKQKIIQHRDFEKFKTYILVRLEIYAKDEIIQAIANYKAILDSKEHFPDYKWSIYDFLSRKNGLDSYLTVNKPFDNFKNRSHSPGKKSQRQTYTDEEAIEKIAAP